MPRLSHRQSFLRPRASFTLVELLVVIAIIAILSVVVVMTINPVEMLRKARDSNRSADLNTLNKALSIYETDQPAGSLGSATTVYVSIPDSSATCANLGLPTLPSGYTYACATTANYRKTDGTGWVPVPFTDISAGSPIGTLPIDPTNTTSTGLYYTYIPGGSWELDASIESSAYKLGGDKDRASTDGGDNPSQMEVGTNLRLLPVEYGDTSLIAYYKFENSIADHSGHSNTGTWGGVGTHYTAGKIGSYAGQFNGSNDRIVTGNNGIGALRNATMSSWVNAGAQGSTYRYIFDSLERSSGGYLIYGQTSTTAIRFGAGSSLDYTLTPFSPNIFDSTWHFIAGVQDASASKIYIYIDGQLIGSGDTGTVGSGKSTIAIGSAFDSTSFFAGLLDDFRIYNRTLSAAEILALYNSTK